MATGSFLGSVVMLTEPQRKTTFSCIHEGLLGLDSPSFHPVMLKHNRMIHMLTEGI